MVETPVLFITFVRPDYARQTWEGIKAAKPKALYFYSNKGRAEKAGEVECNNKIRAYIDEIDWECDLHIWFREECANVYDSLRGAIDWLFNNEASGIILEEDCVPTLSFFSFMDQMIEKFQDEDKVFCISGDNFVDESMIYGDYYFSHYHYMYGWATWANRWKNINWNKTLKKDEITDNQFKKLYLKRMQIRYRVKEMRSIVDFINETKCWDYYWGYEMDLRSGLTVHPKYHLVTNIGLSGTHHSNSRESPINKRANFIRDIYPISIDSDIKVDKKLDYVIFRTLQYGSFFHRVKSSLRYRIPLYLNKISSIFRGKEKLKI